MIQSFIWLMIGHIEKHAILEILYFKMVYRTKSRVNWIQVCVWCGSAIPVYSAQLLSPARIHQSDNWLELHRLPSQLTPSRQHHFWTKQSTKYFWVFLSSELMIAKCRIEAADNNWDKWCWCGQNNVMEMWCSSFLANLSIIVFAADLYWYLHHSGACWMSKTTNDEKSIPGEWRQRIFLEISSRPMIILAENTANRSYLEIEK